MQKLLLIMTLLGSCIASCMASAGNNSVPQPAPSAYTEDSSVTPACPVGSFLQSVIDESGHVIDSSCVLEASLEDANTPQLHRTRPCGPGRLELGVYDWRGQFQGTVCRTEQVTHGR